MSSRYSVRCLKDRDEDWRHFHTRSRHLGVSSFRHRVTEIHSRNLISRYRCLSLSGTDGNGSCRCSLFLRKCYILSHHVAVTSLREAATECGRIVAAVREPSASLGKRVASARFRFPIDGKGVSVVREPSPCLWTADEKCR